MDSCVIPLGNQSVRHGLFLVQTTDFFYPLIDDPYVMVSFHKLNTDFISLRKITFTSNVCIFYREE